MSDFLKFMQITKLQEDDKGRLQVFGVATWQKPDLDNEACDYETAVPVYKTWSDAALARTTGAGQEPSMGNVRLQHGIDIGGKATGLEYDDSAKEIRLLSVPLNDEIADHLRKGFYTGYSQGGRYAWRKCSECDKTLTLSQASNYCPSCKKNVIVNYALASLSEVSYVDSPCTGKGFDYVKADGSSQTVKFTKRSVPVEKTPEQIAAEKRAKVAAAALVMLKAGVDAKAKESGLKKGLYDVSSLAEILQRLSYLWESALWERDYEGDGSEVPDDLKEHLDSLCEVFIAMATEEANELAAQLSGKSNKGVPTMKTQEELDAIEKAAKATSARHFAKAAVAHEKLAAHHESEAESHAEMCDAAKAFGAKKADGNTDVNKEDVSGEEPHASVSVAPLTKALIAHHSKMGKVATKCAGVHKSLAEHYHKMAEESDKDESEKTVKALKAEQAAADAADPTPAAIVKKAPELNEDVEAAEADLRETPEYKKAVKAIAQQRLDLELEELRKKTIIPDGVRLTDGASGLDGLKVVPRTNPPKDINFDIDSNAQNNTICGM